MTFAVVACSRCKNAWSLDLAVARSSCPRCPAQVETSRRTRLWQGDDARDAAAAAAAINTALAQGRPVEDAAQAAAALRPAAPMPRHDSPADAAAAKARSLTNQSQRAEAVALWLTRLVGRPSDDDLMAALRKAGLSGVRAEKEIVRMLACDILYEPAAGRYAALEA